MIDSVSCDLPLELGSLHLPFAVTGLGCTAYYSGPVYHGYRSSQFGMVRPYRQRLTIADQPYRCYDNNGLGYGARIGIGIGIAAAVILLFALCGFWRRK
jgi:hypothetical protein